MLVVRGLLTLIREQTKQALRFLKSLGMVSSVILIIVLYGKEYFLEHSTRTEFSILTQTQQNIKEKKKPKQTNVKKLIDSVQMTEKPNLKFDNCCGLICLHFKTHTHTSQLITLDYKITRNNA